MRSGAEVRLLVDLDHRVDLSPRLEDLLHLVRGDRVQPAAEGVELDQGQVVRGRATACAAAYRRVWYTHWSTTRSGRWILPEVRHRVLREHRHSEGDGELRDPVIDLGIQVVGPAGQDEPAEAPPLNLAERRSPCARTSALNAPCSARPASTAAATSAVVTPPRRAPPVSALFSRWRVMQGEERIGVAHRSRAGGRPRC